jgi:hypothetical protein
MTSFARLGGVMAMSALGAFACEANVVEPTSGGGGAGAATGPGSTTGSADGGGGALIGMGGAPTSIGCPEAPPGDGAPCTGNRFCTYGDAIEPVCRQRFWCDGDAWSALAVDDDCGGNECAAEAPEDGSPCDVSDLLICGYPDGTLCGCDGSESIWSCYARPGGPCPLFVPNAGAPCDDPGIMCLYGDGGFCAWGAHAGCSEAGTWYWAANCSE